MTTEENTSEKLITEKKSAEQPSTEKETTDKLTQRKSKHGLQLFAKVIGMLSMIIAFFTGGYLLLVIENPDKIQQSFLGAITFFCFILGLVLHYISTTNLPDLSVPSNDEIKEQSDSFLQSENNK